MDTVHGSAITKGTLLVLTERLTRYEIMFKMPDNKTAAAVGCLDTLKRQYGNLFSSVFKSITVDNGSELADYAGLQRSIGEYLMSGTKISTAIPTAAMSAVQTRTRINLYVAGF
jgi:IS30 family transposase